MTRSNLDQLARRVSLVLRGSVGAESFIPLFRQIFLLLVNGTPVSLQQIAAQCGKSREEVARVLQDLPSVEWDDKGNLIGRGLTLRSTPHKFEVEGRTLFTWCAMDALMFPVILGKPARIESPCVATGTQVCAQVTPEKVKSIEPSSAVVSLIMPKAA